VNTLGVLLRRLRTAAGLSQRELALRAGLSVKAVSALEQGYRRRPYPNTLRALASALSLSVQERHVLIAAAAAPANLPGAGSTALHEPEAVFVRSLADLHQRLDAIERVVQRLLSSTNVGEGEDEPPPPAASSSGGR
jgi:transcriptional regulator with XRE-family HTH domain